jgi:SAM-dependent methyltransferase
VGNPNAEMIASWNDPSVETWVRDADGIERQLAAFTAAVLAKAAPVAGERALDVGCGCGRTSYALRERTGADVVGIDVSARLLAAARAGAPAGVTFIEDDASCYEFAGDFDLVLSRFGVMFFVQPEPAFTNLRTALRRGGRLAFTCWREVERNAWASLPLSILRELEPGMPAFDTSAPGPFAFANADRVRAILDHAGFSGIEIVSCDAPMPLADSLEDAVREVYEDSPLAGTRDPARARAALAAGLAPFVTPSGVVAPSSAWLVTALSV